MLTAAEWCIRTDQVKAVRDWITDPGGDPDITPELASEMLDEALAYIGKLREATLDAGVAE